MQKSIQRVTKVVPLAKYCRKSSPLSNMRLHINQRINRLSASQFCETCFNIPFGKLDLRAFSHFWKRVFPFRVHPFQNGLRTQNKTKFEVTTVATFVNVIAEILQVHSVHLALSMLVKKKNSIRHFEILFHVLFIYLFYFYLFIFYFYFFQKKGFGFSSKLSLLR